MRYFYVFPLFLAAALFFSGCTQQQKVVEDIVAAHPEHAKVVFENAYVNAVEFTLSPGDKLPLHKGGARVVYSLSDYKLKWTEADEESEKEWAKGDAHWHAGIDHAAENIGDTEAQYIVVTRTDSMLPDIGDYDISQDASQLDPEHAKNIFENEHVRIVEVMLPPGESQPLHQGINRLIYSLSSYNIKYVSDQIDKETQTEQGEAHWHAADQHAVQNIGETDAHYIIFEFKK
ncbi:hypothetical protein EH223_00915 [candidate division KSB1 bacterium]|nr:hypothetical protein [candidate division KSB1 bacterium]RQW07213.1 MAG: hypothetical protein EH223_00915 [candidate division KSB1 bacterium]